MTLREIVEQLQSCNYECEAGTLENNLAFQELRRQALAVEKPMQGSSFVEVAPGITLGCMSADARDLLDFLYAQWGLHLRELEHISQPADIAYSLLYWLVRYSGFIEPSLKAKAIISGNGIETAAAPCPYICKDGNGVSQCQLAEVGLRVLDRKLQEITQDRDDRRHEFTMYSDAWQRELGGRLICKTHRIDALVLTTRALRERAEKFAGEASELRELLWSLYEGLYGHRNALNIDPFKTAVSGALEVKKEFQVAQSELARLRGELEAANSLKITEEVSK